ncbi:hypothetical protein CLM85_05145 [Streptomyces albidoflavus]|uniref:DUF4259 domain-containing protein n=1 Tax=Streptomyces albidoflavus TaxID=1886 RepID=UPI000BAE43FE|nr:hypothetical protein CLM81_24425 [Streptomyces albidoflavus]PAX92228.1 hypothetical protein CLM82_04710 [Streptomyces albidoflavus]PBO19876.1 hypothetical protein CLM83_03980 [Streptomyces albidoflavus]PBO25303.1 hypothetical protein CLM85_05145 [Streptomyces albidoflavus]PBO31157.1 hypothetical protein CLM84_04155 [Streptomyces albidoflavus]
MGTWGSGPFDSDTAEDFLDEMEERSAPQRLEVVEHTFRTAIEAGGNSTSSVLPEEVVAAAAVVAANVPTGRSLPWNEEYPSVTEWLAKPVAPLLASSAIQALELTVPTGGRFWRSWVDADEREEAQAAINSLRAVLLHVSEGGSR